MSYIENIDTKRRILSAALIVFANKGITNSTLREITEAADANIAAVNYHFGSKEKLISDVITTYLHPINEARIAYLEASLKKLNSGPADVRVLVEAIVRPMVHLSHDHKGGRSIVRILMQVRAMPSVTTNNVVSGEFDPVHERFVEAFARSLPHLSRDQVILRYDFARGAVMQILSDIDPSLGRVRGLSPAVRDNEELIIRSLVSFISAGFLAD